MREQNKQKYQQFRCSLTAGGSNNSIQVDFNNYWFIFAINNRDYNSGNPQIFDFSQMQDFWLEQEYRTLSDSDHDGIPDNRDNFDNRQLNDQNNGFNNSAIGVNSMSGNMQAGMFNIPLSAQPFVRNNESNYSSSDRIKEVSGIKACFRVTDPYITNDISFTVASVSSNDQMKLMQAYETGVQIMQLCQQIRQGGVQNMNQGFGQQINNGYGQPVMQNGYVQQQMQQGYGQNAVWICPNCGMQNTSEFCSGCGIPKQ